LKQLSKNIAKKLAIDWAIFWNFYMILIYVFLFILSVLIFRISFFDFCKQSLQPPLDNQEKVYIIVIPLLKNKQEKEKTLDNKRKEGYNRYSKNLKVRIS